MPRTYYKKKNDTISINEISDSGECGRLVTKVNAENKKVVASDVLGISAIGNATDRGKKIELLSCSAMKLVFIAIAQCAKDDREFFEYHISISEMAKIYGVSPQVLYKERLAICFQLSSAVFAIRYLNVDNPKDADFIPIFSRCTPYKTGEIVFKINHDLYDYFLELKHDFFSTGLTDYMQMKSIYSMIIWTYVKSKLKQKPNLNETVYLELSVDSLRKMTQTSDKLSKISDLRKVVLDKAIREINTYCNVKITYEAKKHGREIVAFILKIVSSFHIDTSKMSQQFLDKVTLKSLMLKKKTRALSKKESKQYEELMAVYGDPEGEWMAVF